jgi:hypothetical protein
MNIANCIHDNQSPTKSNTSEETAGCHCHKNANCDNDADLPFHFVRSRLPRNNSSFNVTSLFAALNSTSL